MNQTLHLTNVCNFMKTHLVEVFEVMLATQAVAAMQDSIPPVAERVTGSVGFAGETVNGAIYLHLSAAFAKQAAAAILGLTPEEISSESDVNDVVGEVTNMITGGLKSWLCDAGAPCAMSTPAIIRGNSFSVEPASEVEHTVLAFSCGGESVLVEIHVKFI